jgi:formyltetrahydrofolate hydrolase
MSVAPAREYVLALSCRDKPGNVYSLSSFLLQHSANILASQQCGESPDVRFFMWAHFSVPPQNAQLARDRELARLERGPSPGDRGVSHVPGSCTPSPRGSAS